MITIPALVELWRSSRRFRWGLCVFAGVVVLALGGIGVGVYRYGPQSTRAAPEQSIDPAMIAQRLRSEIETRYQRDVEAARKEGKYWDAIRELEQVRDAALGRVDEIVSTLRDGLAGNPDPVFREALRILAQEGSAAALGYLESHQAEVSREDPRRSLQPLLLKADLHRFRQEWDVALNLLRTVADKAPKWWEARWRAGSLLRELARFDEAEPHLRAAVALAVKEKELSEAINVLAQLLQDTGRLAESEPLLRRNLVIDQQRYGPDHPDVGRDLNDLASLLLDTGRPAEAEPMMRRALTIAEKVYGPGHPSVARDLNNLAVLLKTTNRLAKAEPLMQRALAIDEKNFGPEHPSVARDLNNLAQLLQATQRLAEAEPLMRRALAIDEKSYGPEHPAVAAALNNLAQLLQDTQRLAKAEPLLRRALVIVLKFTRSTGHEHPHLQDAIGNYRQLLAQTGLDQARIAQRLAEIATEAGYDADEWRKLEDSGKGAWKGVTL